MRYEMAQDGINKLFIAQLIMITAIIVTSFTFMIDVSAGFGAFVASVLDLLSMLAVLFAFVFMLMGYFSLQKEEKAFRLPFVLSIVGILAQIAFAILLFGYGATEATVMEIASDFIEIMIVLSSCGAFIKMLRILHGNSNATSAAGKVAKAFMITMVIASGIDVLSIYTIKQNMALTILLAFLYLICACVAYIIMLFFFSKVKKVLV